MSNSTTSIGAIYDYGIEYGHIYTNQQFNSDHLESINILKSLETELSGASRIILIDDYSPNISIKRFDFNKYLKSLEMNKATPNVVVLESDLVKYCNKLLDEILDKKLKESITRYFQSTNKYPCSLFIAAWYLLRLGEFGRPNIKCVLGDPDKLLSKEIITIIPEYFKPAEGKALKIILNTKYTDCLKSIKQIYFKSVQ